MTPLIFALSAALLLSLHLRIGINLDDEGLLCDYADRILRGERPYVDFVPPYAIGRYYAVAAAFRVFGESVVVGRALFLLLLAAAAALSHRIALRVLPPALAWLPPALVTLLPPALWKTDLPCGLALAALAAIRYAEAPSRGRAAAAGAVIGALVWDRPDLPLFACALVLAARLTSPAARGRPIGPDAAACTAAATALVAPLAAYVLFVPGALAGFLDAHLWMTRLASEFGLAMPSLLGAGLGIVNGALFYAGPALAAVALGLAAWRWWRGRLAMRDAALVVLALAALLIWNQVRIRANYGHALQATLPVFLLGPALLFQLADRLLRGRAALAAALVILPWPLVVWQGVLANVGYAGVVAVTQGRATRTHWARADVWLPPQIFSRLAAVKALLEERGGHALVVPYQPMLNFLARVPNPTFLDNFLPGRLDDTGQRRVIEDLERKETRTVIRADAQTPGFPPFPRYAGVLWRHVEQRYEEAEPRGGFRIYVRAERTGR